MKLIKLDATNSTNDFLKNLARHQNLENFTIVSTKKQTDGRGQMGAKWESEEGKNITISILAKDIIFDITHIYNLNIVVAISVLDVLKSYHIPQLSIKWPNDIMSGSKKMGGILIENSIKSAIEIESIVGIGINVNQRDFGNLPTATSMHLESNTEFDLDDIICKIDTEIRKNCTRIKQDQQAIFWQLYHQNLFKINVPMLFEDANNNQFTGIIKNVSQFGKLEVLQNNQIVSYSIKEIKMLY